MGRQRHDRRRKLSGAIFEKLKREEIGDGQPWQQRWRTLAKAQDDRVEAWADAQLGIDPSEPLTALEHRPAAWARQAAKRREQGDE